jgi:uncharacterized repeat protein (TIGR01451 family)
VRERRDGAEIREKTSPGTPPRNAYIYLVGGNDQMKRSLLAIAVASALALVLAGGAFFAFKSARAAPGDPAVGPVLMSPYLGNPDSHVKGQTGWAPYAPAPAYTAGTGAATDTDSDTVVDGLPGITPWNTLNPPAYVALAYYTEENCLPPSQVAVMASNVGSASAIDLRLQNSPPSAGKSGLLVTLTGSPWVGTTTALKSAGIVVVAGDFQCGDNVDSDGDGAINDGCSTAGAAAETNCAETSCPDADGQRPWDGTCDDDADGAINDGCAVNGTKEQLVILDAPNFQYLACGNTDGTAVTGWDGLLTDDWKLIQNPPPPWVTYAAIDVDVTNGMCHTATGTDDSIDSSTSVEIGETNDIAVCFGNFPAPGGDPLNGVAKFSMDVLYNPAKNSCENPDCLFKMPCTEDDMPDLNEGDTLGQGVPTVPDMGDGWSCNGFGFGEPACAGGVATIACGSLNGPFPPTGPGIAFPFFVVTFTAEDVGIDNLSLANGTTYDQPGISLGSCNPWNELGGDPVLTCIGAEVDKVPPAPRADLSVVKTDDPDPVAVGKDVVYTITVKNNVPAVGAALDATDVVLVDTLPVDKVYVAASATCDAGTCTDAANVVTCNLGTIAVDASVVCTITATAAKVGVSTNVVDVTTSTNETELVNNHDTEDTTEVPAGVLMVKEPGSDVLWLMRNVCDPEKPDAVRLAEGKGCLVINKMVYAIDDTDSPNDSDSVPEGLGAWEEQIKYDHKLLTVVAVPDTEWLESGGRIAMCTATILTENWTLTGCVTKDRGWCADNLAGPEDDPAGDQGYINDGCPVVGVAETVCGEAPCGDADSKAPWDSCDDDHDGFINDGCPAVGNPESTLGPNGDGLIEKIYLYPKTDDLIYRQGFRPTKDNGIRTDLVDENCEVADTLGEKIPGTLPGGLTATCTDAHITMRMLEGDVNLDCVVNCIDDQAIAFRYGTFFGLTLYDEWYDLAPECVTYACDTNDDTVVDGKCEQCTSGVPDFDIDIKDLQFVFGRNYSTCQAPIPDTQGVPMLPPQDEFE